MPGEEATSQDDALKLLLKGLQGVSLTSKDVEVKASELGFFYPNAPLTPENALRDMCVEDNKSHYRDVFAFSNRLANLAGLKTWKAVSKVVDQALLGEANTWWNVTLNDNDRRGYISDNGLDDFIKNLKDRFKPPPSQALDRLHTTRYTAQDVMDRKSVAEFIGRIQSVVQGVGHEDERSVVTYAWKNIDLPMRAAMAEPLPLMTIKEFTKLAMSHQSNWFDQHQPPPARAERTIAREVYSVYITHELKLLSNSV
ncbi:hypothetical protein F5882DRAFT_465317 [Hyaloscypha sp. PMI_1271]|nr:hypothetical protein F5882DRAFT_465317 [Hyaloscypha sp. PMI_1271]